MYVHQAIDKTWAEKAVAVEFDAGSERVPLAAQLQASTKSLVVRMVNMNSLSMPVALSLGKASNSAAGSVVLKQMLDIDPGNVQIWGMLQELAQRFPVRVQKVILSKLPFLNSGFRLAATRR